MGNKRIEKEKWEEMNANEWRVSWKWKENDMKTIGNQMQMKKYEKQCQEMEIKGKLNQNARKWKENAGQWKKNERKGKENAKKAKGNETEMQGNEK